MKSYIGLRGAGARGEASRTQVGLFAIDARHVMVGFEPFPIRSGALLVIPSTIKSALGSLSKVSSGGSRLGVGSVLLVTRGATRCLQTSLEPAQPRMGQAFGARKVF